MNSIGLVPAEADPFEQPFELRTGDKAGQNIVDLVGLYIVDVLDPIGIDPQPEAAEIA